LTERDSATQTTDALTGPVLRQIGYHLKLAREERGETLQDIAAFLRIRRVYLRDLENGDLSAIPGRAYALGFLRSYGDYLGFNGEAIVEEVKRTDEPLPESPTLQVREPLLESHRPPLVLVAASIALAGLVYVGWQYWHERQESPPQVAAADRPAGAVAGVGEPANRAGRATLGAATSDATGRDAAPAPADGPSAAVDGVAADQDEFPPLPAIPEPPMPASAEALTERTEITAAATTAQSDAAVAAILNRPAPGAEADAVAETDASGDNTASPAGGAEPSDLLAAVAAESGGADLRTFGDEDAADSRVVLVASQPSWVQVKSRASDYVWTRTLEPGDAYFVPENGEDLALWTGNAGGLKVVLDGEPLAPLGEPGQVRRDIPLAADALSAQYARD
jgi:cytoskeleton protein RodZ